MCDLCEDPPAWGTTEEWVAAGVELLDRWRPGWDALVDLAVLDLACGDWCVLGQVFESYSYGLEMLDIDAPAKYGFNAWDDEFGQLTQAWREAITERRLATITN